MGSKKNWKKFKKAAAKVYGKGGNMLPEFMDYMDPCGDSSGSISDLVMSQGKMSNPYPNGLYRNPSDGGIAGLFSPRINPSVNQFNMIDASQPLSAPSATNNMPNELVTTMQFNCDLGFIRNTDPTIKDQYDKGNIRDIVTRSGDDIFCRVSPYVDIRSTIDLGDESCALNVSGYYTGNDTTDIDPVTNIITYAMLHETGYDITEDENLNTEKEYYNLLHRYVAALGYIYQHLDQCNPSDLLDAGIIISTIAEFRVWARCVQNSGKMKNHQSGMSLSGAYYFNDVGCYKYSGIISDLASDPCTSGLFSFMYSNPSVDPRFTLVSPYKSLQIPSTGKIMIVYVMNYANCSNIIQMASDLYTKNNPRPVNTVTSSAVPPVEN